MMIQEGYEGSDHCRKKKSAMHMPLPNSYPHESPRKVFYCLNEHVHAIKNVLYNWNHLLKLFFFLWTAIKENIKVT